ncbi:MAG TPA: FAD-dependent monooxygenase [Acidimicrobiia bacterium]|nr:FAD-dependent monooxygenase [Acidimicrobiia bacterium]
MEGVRRVSILGGGPGGLYAAGLLKRRHPGMDVVVYERNERGATFGFGVGLTGRARDSLATADPETFEAIMARGWSSTGQEFRLPGGDRAVIAARDPHFGVGRAPLLHVLAERALELGVVFELGRAFEADELDGDVVVAADGANSATRTKLASQFGADVEVGRELYLWCGADFRLDHPIFAAVRTEHGTFVAHAYPYGPDRSTFLVETDETTWRRAGFDATTAALAGAPPGASDDASIAYLSAVFADHLGGHTLLGNRTRWLRFPTVRCERWHAGRVVLLGDAAHTAHYSVGSGTKLALEDAIALVDALGQGAGVEPAFDRYEAARRPPVERLQRLARRSQLWWESFPRRLDSTAHRLAVSYMTRAGALSLAQLHATNPELVRSALADYAGVAPEAGPPARLDGWVVDQPLAWRDRRFESRRLERLPEGVDSVSVGISDPWGSEADDLVAMVGERLAAGAAGVCLRGDGGRDALLDRLAVGERLRLETPALVIVEVGADHGDVVAAGLAAGRTHLILQREEVGS